MADHIDIADFTEGESIKDFYIAKQKQVKQTRAGKDYLDLVIMDRSGTANGKVWDDAPGAADLFQEGDIIKIEALIGTYKDTIDLNIKRLRAATADDPVGLEDLMPASPYDPAEMEQKIRGLLDTISNPHLKALADSFLADDDFMNVFRRMTASKLIHHAYAAGLLEHTLSVMEILDNLSGHYTGIDRDRLLTGGFLHDIGKMKELSDSADMSYTEEGTLLGHMFLGAEMVRERIAKLEAFPPALATEVLHMVLSHQGEPDWGSPVVPMTREALIIHFVDNMDAKQFVVKRALAEARGDSPFTGKIYPLNRPIYRGRDDE
ncbi:3'-5' exoribonuclease YhaM family protein [Planctomycetota bacterium]